jgi:hypothetical protein
LIDFCIIIYERGSTVLAKEQGASVQTPILSRDYTYNKQGMVRKMIRNVAGSLLSQFGTATFTDTYAYDHFGCNTPRISNQGDSWVKIKVRHHDARAKDVDS